MKQYKGYYIDNAFFHSRNEIDEAIRLNLLLEYKKAVEKFNNRRNRVTAQLADSMAASLVNNYGFTWGELDEIDKAIFARLAS